MLSGRGKAGVGRVRVPTRRAGGLNDFEVLWTNFETALQMIYTKNASEISFEQLYRYSYKIVSNKQAEALLERVEGYERNWLTSVVVPELRKLITSDILGLTTNETGKANSKNDGTTNERRLNGEKFLKGFASIWDDYSLCTNMTSDVLMYMDRQLLTRHFKIYAICMGLFRQALTETEIHDDASGTTTTPMNVLNAVLLDMIHMERQGDVIDKALVKHCINLFEQLYESPTESELEKIYLTIFEPLFLKETRQFYRGECQRLLDGANASTWLQQTHRRINEEKERCKTTIPGVLTETKLLGVLHDEMIRAHMSEFLALEGTGIKAMIENDRYEDLEMLYILVEIVDNKKQALQTALRDLVYEMGSSINKTILNPDSAVKKSDDTAQEKTKPEQKATAVSVQTEAAIRWVGEVLELRNKFDTILSKSLSDDLILQSGITKSFQEFINEFERQSEFLSLFVDSNMKSGQLSERTEEETDAILSKATKILTYIQDKDLFERYYKKHLARRLLQGKSENNDVEKLMISKMKNVIGSYFTSKLEGMFKDMSRSAELTSMYRTHITSLGDRDTKQIDLAISVLTTNNWPIEIMGIPSQIRERNSQHQHVIWPAEMKALQDSFKNFYNTKHTGRELSWVPYLGSADVRCHFPKIEGKEGALGKDRRYELVVSTAGAILLLQFNDLKEGESLSFEELQERTKLEPKELIRLLTSLSVLPKAKVLNKDPANKHVKPGDRFSINNSFTSKSIRIKAPVVSGMNKAEGTDERKSTVEKNDQDRGLVVDAIIVRTMKQRKILEHQQLLTEVITQLASRFKPDVTMIKKKIESLIDKEYLERVEDAERPTYKYLA